MVKMEIQTQVQAQVNTQAKPETKSQIYRVSISSEAQATAVHLKNGASTGVSLYRRPYAWFKRFIDILLSLILLIPSGLIIAVCYVAIKLETKGPAFFVQERPGYKGKVFKILKLRTMIVERERNGRELSDMERMTKVGKIVRTCSFDELPQIFNILRGQMSFIGPRPLLVGYLSLYSPEQARRHDVLPGISGWAQVNGRNELTWGQKFERDVWYVDHMSFGLDMKILWMTIKNVLNHQGINAGVNDTMQVFQGNGASLTSTMGGAK